jgi:Rhodopirellula transposase DDE domain
LGHGGVNVVARATGLARSTIYAGLRDLQRPSRQRAAVAQRIRRVGGGRRPATSLDPALLNALVALIEPTTRGDPESPLRWTCQSTRQLAEVLTRQRHP